MNLRSTIIGIAASAILLAVLGLARLFPTDVETPDLEIREVEIASFQPPPPPPPPQDPPPDAPPPPPALTEVSNIPDPTRVPIPKADIPMDLRAPVENFFTDAAPAPLPIAPKPVRETPPTPTRKVTPPAVVKSHYDTSELDGTPQVLRYGTPRFPSSLARKGVSRGTVIFEVEIYTNGSVSIRRVISSTHPELVSPARKVVAGARFTPPKRNGKVVKAIMRWPIVIQK